MVLRFPFSLQLLLVGGILVRVASIFVSAADSDWPSYRRDAALSAHSPLRGGFGNAPKLLWSTGLGGKEIPSEAVRVEDINGDGTDEFLRISKRRLTCHDLAGNPLWQSDEFSTPTILEIRDFAGNGGRGMIVEDNTGTEVRTWMVDGKTGGRSELTRRRNVFGYRHRFGRILNGIQGHQFCYWWDGQDNELTGPIAHGRLWSFEKGLLHPTTRLEVTVPGKIYSAQQLFADMDLDGRDEMVMVSHEQIWIYDLVSGREKGYSKWLPSIRSYSAAMALISLAPGERPSLLMVNPHIPGLEVLRWDGTNVTRAWKKVIGPEESQYQQRVQIQEALPDPFLDLDRDGRIEIFARITNEHGDGKSHLVVFDALSGKRLFDKSNLEVDAITNMDGDSGNIPEVVIRDGSVLRIANWKQGEWIDRWRGTNVTPELDSSPCDRSLRQGMSFPPHCNPTVARDPTKSNAYVFRFDSQRRSCVLGQGGMMIDRIPMTPFQNADSKANRTTWRWEGTTLITSSNGRPLFRYSVPTTRVYMPPPALVDNLDRERHIVVRDAEGTLISLGTNGRSTRPLLRRSPAYSQADGLYYTHLGTAVICDLEGDNVNELLACGRNEDGSAAVVAVNGIGVVKQRFAPPSETIQLALGPTGSLGDGRGLWFVVRFVRKFGRDAVVAYDGQTGKQLWLRDEFNPQGRTTKFVLHIPSSVYDYDRDGAEDLIALSENFYGVISVKENRNLVEPFDLTASLRGHWPAYATPLLLSQPGGAMPHVFLSRAYAVNFLVNLAGRPIWHWGLSRDTTPRNHAAVADLDGDGLAEVVVAQADGTITAYGAHSNALKCPICPPADLLGVANRAAHIRWVFQIPSPIGGAVGANQNSDQDFASADLDGDGNDEILIGGGDGKLYALKELNGACRLMWAVDLGARVGSPILADLDGDGVAEIVVPTENGRMHGLGR